MQHMSTKSEICAQKQPYQIIKMTNNFDFFWPTDYSTSNITSVYV